MPAVWKAASGIEGQNILDGQMRDSALPEYVVCYPDDHKKAALAAWDDDVKHKRIG